MLNFETLNIYNSNINNFRNVNVEQKNKELIVIPKAFGLEMEATYIINPLTTEDRFESFYVPSISKIITYIDKKYGADKYKYIQEAEVSGRTCAGVSIIKPDPRHSMLEIATDQAFGFKKTLEFDDLLDYSTYLIKIQKNAIKDLNLFFKKEKLYKNRKYKSIVPYPYAMSNRLKNAEIILNNKKDTKNKTNYTGSYHVTITIPYNPLIKSLDVYYENYKRYINQFQWIEPMIIAFYTTTDMRGIGSEKVRARASYRILMSGWGNPAGSDVRKFDQGLTRKVNIPLYWRKGLNFEGMEKLEKYCADPKKKYAHDYVDPDRDLYDMGGDFRTPSGDHGQDWSVRDRPLGGPVEMRILDFFPPQHMASLLRILAFIIENATRTENKIYVYKDKDWIKTIQNVFKEGWCAKIPKGYINKLEKALDLKFPKKPLMLDSFFDVFLNTLYKKNKNGFYVNQLLRKDYKKQPKLTKSNPNRESWDFGFLLKLSDNILIRNKIKKVFTNINKMSLKEVEKYYKKNMTSRWKNNMIDIIYFFELRGGIKIIKDNNGFIKTINVNNKKIINIVDNYEKELFKLWPNLHK